MLGEGYYISYTFYTRWSYRGKYRASLGIKGLIKKIHLYSDMEKPLAIIIANTNSKYKMWIFIIKKLLKKKFYIITFFQ